MLSRIPAIVTACAAIALLCLATLSFHQSAEVPSDLLQLNGMVGGQMAHLTVVGPLHEGLVPVVGTVGDERVHGRISLSKIQNPSRIPEAAQALSPDYDAPIHLHVIVHPNGQIDGMPVSLKDAATAKILRTLVKKFGGSSHAVVLDGDLRRYPQGHKPRDAIDVDASDAAPAPSPAAPHHARLSQTSGLDPWAQQAFVHAGDNSRSYARSSPASDGTESGNVLRRRSESPDDGRLPSLPPALAAGSTVTSAADAAIGSQFPLPSLQQDPQAGKFNIDYDSGRPVAPNFHALLVDARRVARERVAQYGRKASPRSLGSQRQELAEVQPSRASNAASQRDYQRAFYAMKGEAAAEAAHQATLGRLRGRVTDTLATKKQTTKPKPEPPAPNFMFYPATKAMPGGARSSVPAEPMIKLLRLLRSITDSLNAVVKKDKTMQQEIQQQGAELATLKAHRELKQPQQPIVHTALSMQSVSFPTVAPASELTAHPGDVLQVGNSQIVLPSGMNPGVYNVRDRKSVV